MRDVMLDLETMGKCPDAAIIAIGAVEFDVKTPQIGEKFYALVNLESAVLSGGVMDASTVLWWMKQSEDARNQFLRVSVGIDQALADFSLWMKARAPVTEVRVWGNGAAFDNVVLASAYRRLRLLPPWLFKNDRCYRTVKSLYPDVEMRREGTLHNAVDDAESQARHMIDMFA